MKARISLFWIATTLRRRNVGLALATTLWLLAVGGAMAALGLYSNRAGASGGAGADWPADSALVRAEDRPTLLLIAHPRCPCTRATMGELEKLLAQSNDRPRIHVLFIQPAGTPDDWTETDLWRTASALPEVTVHRDLGGVEARRFHAETSGQVLLYGRDGRLLFQGGITVSRGHAGDNVGREAIVQLLGGESPRTNTTPVFGCPLSAPTALEEGPKCPL